MSRSRTRSSLATLLIIVVLISTFSTVSSSVFLAGVVSAQEPSTNKDSAQWAAPGRKESRNPENAPPGPLNSDSYVMDADSIELVIGLDQTNAFSHSRLVDMISMFNCRVINTISARGIANAIVVDVPLQTVSLLEAEIEKNGFARYMEPNMKVQAQFVPNDPNWTLQWGPQKVEADWAWNTTTGNSSIIVAVIDTGIDYNHPDLAANYVPLGFDWVNNDTDPLDDYGHGTHVAGIIGAVINNMIGIAGIADVSMMAEKMLGADGSGTSSNLANAIIHATDAGARIVSMSLGGYGYSQAEYEAVKYAYDAGVLLIAAAGNDYANRKFYPAGFEEVVAVSATDQNDAKADFSNWGDWIEVSAPGVGIYSTMPTYYVTLNDYGYPMDYASLSGTSMATPHVSGVAALVWSLYPNKTREIMRLWLQYTSDDIGEAGFDKYFGYGRVNARKALEPNPEHELIAYSIKKPKYIQPMEVVSMNLTLFNLGASDEYNVTVQFLVNGSLTDSVTLPDFTNSTASTINFTWNPLEEATYNVTFYVVPVSGEAVTENNSETVEVTVEHITGFVLFDQEYCAIMSYNKWMAGLMDKGYKIEYWGASISEDLLAGFDVFVVPQKYLPFSAAEVSAIQNFVSSGGGLLVLSGGGGDLWTWGWNSTIPSLITEFAGITWENELHWWLGLTSDIAGHDVTDGVTSMYFEEPELQLNVTSPGISVIQDGSGYGEVVSAVSSVGSGRVVAVSGDVFDDYSITYADNSLLANNVIDWLSNVKYRHDLVVDLDASSYVEPEENILLNATVHNQGLNDETGVELHLLINDSTVGSTTIPSLESGTSFTINYLWNSRAMGTYNVTAICSPVPNENVSSNNIASRIVSVAPALIHPEAGQYVNFAVKLFEGQDVHDTGYYNITFESYIEPHRIIVKFLTKENRYNSTYADFEVLDTMNRRLERGSWINMDMWWTWRNFLWFPFMVETNVSLRSRINLVFDPGDGVVCDSEILALPNLPQIDCWFILYDNQYLDGLWMWAYYDKATGLMTKQFFNDAFGYDSEVLLSDTNIPTAHRDVAVLGITSSRRVVGQGYSTSINVTVQNHGVSAETVNVTVYANSTQIASGIVDLAVSESANLTFTWDTKDFLKGNYTLHAYIAPVPDEGDTADNVILRGWVLVTIAGDVTSVTSGVPDGNVDMRDIGILCSNFMTTPSSPNWDPNLDINNDGAVNMRDIGIACSNFMKN